MATILDVQQEAESFRMDWYDPNCYAVVVQIDDVIKQLGHLTIQQKADIKRVLSKFSKLFDGTLGVYPHRKFHIDGTKC